MKIAICDIKIAERIRKDVTKISELADDVRKHGLLNPITVMKSEGGEFRLLAGLRRLRAAQALGWADIDVNIVTPANAEAALRIEFSENEQREPFTFSERMDFARLIEEIERAKGKERMSDGGKGGAVQGADERPHLERGRSRDIVGAKIGLSGRNYSRAKYIAENAPSEVIDKLDRNETTINRAYNRLVSVTKPGTALPQKDSCAAKPDNGELASKYAAAEHRRGMLETELHNTNLQWQCEREGKNDRIAELRTALDAANKRIAELEALLAEANARIAELEDKSHV